MLLLFVSMAAAENCSEPLQVYIDAVQAEG
ncbi:MAG: hypothetical protein ACI8RZ_001560, partial [Myxococcota bacterium]